MDESKKIGESLDELNRLVIDLENNDMKIEAEDIDVIIINSLPKS